jgi:hypothetical protein
VSSTYYVSTYCTYHPLGWKLGTNHRALVLSWVGARARFGFHTELRCCGHISPPNLSPTLRSGVRGIGRHTFLIFNSLGRRRESPV